MYKTYLISTFLSESVQKLFYPLLIDFYLGNFFYMGTPCHTIESVALTEITKLYLNTFDYNRNGKQKTPVV